MPIVGNPKIGLRFDHSAALWHQELRREWDGKIQKCRSSCDSNRHRSASTWTERIMQKAEPKKESNPMVVRTYRCREIHRLGWSWARFWRRGTREWLWPSDVNWRGSPSTLHQSRLLLIDVINVFLVFEVRGHPNATWMMGFHEAVMYVTFSELFTVLG